MKTPRLPLFAVTTVFALGLACGPAPVRAETPDEAKRHAAAEELLKVRKTEDIVNSTITRMGEMTDRISENAAKQAGPSVDPKTFDQKLRTESRDMIRKELGWEALKPEFVKAYSEAFTEAELKELTAFYQTPVGKKLVAVEPELSGKLSRLSQEKMRAIMPRVVQHIQELVTATKPPGSSPSSLVPPPPGGLPIPPSPPPGLTIPPPPPPGAIPSAPPTTTATPPVAPPTMTPPPAPPNMIPPPAPPTTATPPPPPTTATPPVAPAPGGTPAIHPGGKTEPGTR